MNVFSLK